MKSTLHFIYTNSCNYFTTFLKTFGIITQAVFFVVKNVEYRSICFEFDFKTFTEQKIDILRKKTALAEKN